MNHNKKSIIKIRSVVFKLQPFCNFILYSR